MAAEREKELLEQKVKELQEQLEDQERVPEELRVKKTEKRREREKTSAGIGWTQLMVGWGGSCSALYNSDRRNFQK